MNTAPLTQYINRNGINVTEEDVTSIIEIVREILRSDRECALSPAAAMEIVANHWNSTVEEMCETHKDDKRIKPRQIIHLILVRHFHWSTVRAGAMVGRKDHATVLHSIKTVVNGYETNGEYRALIDYLFDEMGLDTKKLLK